MKLLSDESLMRLAINEALNSSENLRCGVVVAKDGIILSKTFNRQRRDHDATAHAEILAIRKAGEVLGQKNLNGCQIFCTCEPCTMCLSAIIFSKIQKLTYGLTLGDVIGPNKMISISLNEFLQSSPRKIMVNPNFMEEECKRTLA